MRGVAQFGSAPLWGSGGRGFKSRRSDYLSSFIRDLLLPIIPLALSPKAISTAPVNVAKSTIAFGS